MSGALDVWPYLEDKLSSHCNNTVNYFSTQFLIPVSIFSDFEPSQNTEIEKLNFKKFQSENSKNLKRRKIEIGKPEEWKSGKDKKRPWGIYSMPYWRWPQQINYNRNEYKKHFWPKFMVLSSKILPKITIYYFKYFGTG